MNDATGRAPGETASAGRKNVLNLSGTAVLDEPKPVAATAALSDAAASTSRLPIRPLSLADVIRDSAIEHATVSGVALHFRVMNGLSWFEHDEIASLTARVGFINTLLTWIGARRPSPDEPITLVSLGAGGLLTEYLIHRQLTEAGFTSVHWRAIDTAYPHMYAENRSAFRQTFAGSPASSGAARHDFRIFTTDQAYLAKMTGDRQLAGDDRMDGLTIVLSVDPPTALPEGRGIPATGDECLQIRSVPVPDVTKANCVLLLRARTAYRDELEAVPKALADGGNVVVLNNAIQCSIGEAGEVRINCSRSAVSLDLARELGHRLAALQRPLGLASVDDVFRQYVDELARSPGRDMFGLHFAASDYDFGMANLRAFFRRGDKPVMIASLESNRPSFTCYR